MQIPTTEQLAANLRAAKARRQITDADLAQAIGMSRTALNDRLNGKTEVRIGELQRLAAGLGTTAAALLVVAEPTEATA